MVEKTSSGLVAIREQLAKVLAECRDVKQAYAFAPESLGSLPCFVVYVDESDESAHGGNMQRHIYHTHCLLYVRRGGKLAGADRLATEIWDQMLGELAHHTRLDGKANAVVLGGSVWGGFPHAGQDYYGFSASVDITVITKPDTKG